MYDLLPLLVQDNVQSNFAMYMIVNVIFPYIIINHKLLSGNNIFPYIMNKDEINDIDNIDDFIKSENKKFSIN